MKKVFVLKKWEARLIKKALKRYPNLTEREEMKLDKLYEEMYGENRYGY